MQPVSFFIYFISIHSPYTGRDSRKWLNGYPQYISIHSPYTGRDKEEKSCIQVQMYFNPLSLYRERRYLVDRLFPLYDHFNPLSLYRERL